MAGDAAATLSDGATISSLLPTYWKKRWLIRHEAKLVYDEWAQQEPIPMGNGRTIIWHQMLNPGAGYLIGEGAPPNASAVSARKVSATLSQYGWLQSISDIVDNSSVCPVVNELVDAQGYSGALTKDRHISDKIGFGSAMSTGVADAASAFHLSVFSQGFPVYDATDDILYWPNSSTNKAAGLVQGRFSAVPAISQIRKARTQLAVLNAVEFEDGNYRGVVHPTVSAQIRADTLWPTWNAYSNLKGALQKGMLGVIEGVLFKESSEAFNKTLVASAWSNIGYTSGGGTLYGTLIFGKGAYGVTKLAGKDVTVTVIPTSEKSKSDPLGQVGMVGYKFDLAAKILNPSAGVILTWFKSTLA
jgi:N4-gp56 family major capsid protein